MMKPISIMRVLPQVLFMVLFVVLAAGMIFPAYAATALNEDSTQYYPNGGRPYYLIDGQGSYYLEETFYTTNYFAIRITSSKVILDGGGKTITGDGPAPCFDPKYEECRNDVVGVYVNGGGVVKDVTIKNINVEKKYFGIWLENIDTGRVENCNTSGNHDGIYLWHAKDVTVTGNSTNHNLANGIVLDGNDSAVIDCINFGNTLSNNIANNNGETGIILWLECVNNTLIGNTANDNDHGISLRGDEKAPHLKSPEINTLSGNTTNNNPIGIYLGYNANNNIIKGNTVSQNQDKGIWLWSANNNTIYNNYFNNAVENAGFSGSNTGNLWNVDLDTTGGPNIVGGPSLGGNFWANPNPDNPGFSQDTADSNGDGICDSAYTISSGNVDQFPLHSYEVFEGVVYVNPSDDTCGGHFPCYGTIQAAVNAPYTAFTLKIAKGTYNETFILNETRDITVEGGWDASFTEQTPNTTIIKSPKVNSGSMTFRNLIIMP